MGVVAGVISPDDFADLVTAVATKRDRYAFARLFDFFCAENLCVSAAAAPRPGVADELTQDVMATLWQKAELLDRTKSSVGTCYSGSPGIAASTCCGATARTPCRTHVRTTRPIPRRHPTIRST